MVNCVAVGCNNRSSKNRKGYEPPNDITFHKFPDNKLLRKKWTLAVNRKNWEPSKWSRLCSAHFRESAIDRTDLACVKLHAQAVPCVFSAQGRNKMKEKKPAGNIIHEMPQTSRRKTKRQFWTEDQLLPAINAIRNGSSIRRASIEFGIPASTLRDKLKVVNSEFPECHPSQNEIFSSIKSRNTEKVNSDQSRITQSRSSLKSENVAIVEEINDPEILFPSQIKEECSIVDDEPVDTFKEESNDFLVDETYTYSPPPQNDPEFDPLDPKVLLEFDPLEIKSPIKCADVKEGSNTSFTDVNENSNTSFTDVNEGSNTSFTECKENVVNSNNAIAFNPQDITSTNVLINICGFSNNTLSVGSSLVTANQEATQNLTGPSQNFNQGPFMILVPAKLPADVQGIVSNYGGVHLPNVEKCSVSEDANILSLESTDFNDPTDETLANKTKQVVTKETRDIKRKFFSRMHYCFYCKKTVSHFCRHLIVQHKNELAVKQFKALGNTPEDLKKKRKILKSEISKGNLIYNKSMFKEGGVSKNKMNPLELLPAHQSKKQIDMNKYAFCNVCNGLFKKAYLMRHKKYSCWGKKEIHSKRANKRHQKNIDQRMDKSEDPWVVKVLNIAKKDKLGKVALGDPLLVSVIKDYFKSSLQLPENGQISVNKLRVGACLLLKIQEKDEEVNCLSDIFESSKVGVVKQCMEEFSSLNSFAINLEIKETKNILKWILSNCAKKLMSDKSFLNLEDKGTRKLKIAEFNRTLNEKCGIISQKEETNRWKLISAVLRESSVIEKNPNIQKTGACSLTPEESMIDATSQSMKSIDNDKKILGCGRNQLTTETVEEIPLARTTPPNVSLERNIQGMPGQDEKVNYQKKPKHCCLYCKIFVIKINRHLVTKHKTEKPVMEYIQTPMKTPDGMKKRMRIMKSLIGEGDLFYNKWLVSSWLSKNPDAKNNFTLLTVKRSSIGKVKTVSDYVVCKKCSGLYSKPRFNDHAKRCYETLICKDSPKRSIKYLAKFSEPLVHTDTSKIMKKPRVSLVHTDTPKIIKKPRVSRVSRILVHDSLLLKTVKDFYGSTSDSVKSKYMTTKKHKDGMRLLEKIQEYDKSVNCLTDIFDPSKVDIVVKCIGELGDFDSTTNSLQVFGMSARISWILSECSAKLLQIIETENGVTSEEKVSRKSKVIEFKKLLKAKCNFLLLDLDNCLVKKQCNPLDTNLMQESAISDDLDNCLIKEQCYPLDTNLMQERTTYDDLQERKTSDDVDNCLIKEQCNPLDTNLLQERRTSDDVDNCLIKEQCNPLDTNLMEERTTSDDLDNCLIKEQCNSLEKNLKQERTTSDGKFLNIQLTESKIGSSEISTKICNEKVPINTTGKVEDQDQIVNLENHMSQVGEGETNKGEYEQLSEQKSKSETILEKEVDQTFVAQNYVFQIKEVGSEGERSKEKRDTGQILLAAETGKSQTPDKTGKDLNRLGLPYSDVGDNNKSVGNSIECSQELRDSHSPENIALLTSNLSNINTLETPVHSTETLNTHEQVQDRVHYCIYCKEVFANFTTHLLKMHDNELLVKQYKEIKGNTPEMKTKKIKMLDLIRRKGDLIYNKLMIDKESDIAAEGSNSNLLPTRRIALKKTKYDYVICNKCNGIYVKRSFFMHAKICIGILEDKDDCDDRNVKKKKRYLKTYARPLCKKGQLNDSKKGKRIPVDDSLLVSTVRDYFGSNSRSDNTSKYMMSKKLRDGIKLLKKIQEKDNEVKCMSDIFHCDKVDSVINCIEELCGFDKSTGSLNIRGISARLSWILSECSAKLFQIIEDNENFTAFEKSFKKLNVLEFNNLMKKKCSFLSIDVDNITVDKKRSESFHKDLEPNLCEENKSDDESSPFSDSDNLYCIDSTPKTRKRSASNNHDQNNSKKPKKRKRWTIEEKSIVIKHFENYIKRSARPGYRLCQNLIDKEPLLSSRTPIQMNIYIDNLVRGKVDFPSEFRHLKSLVKGS